MMDNRFLGNCLGTALGALVQILHRFVFHEQ